MNKDIVNCIRAEKDKEAEAKREKERLIEEIKNFFKDLPDGSYIIELTKSIEKQKKDHWYSRPRTSYEHIAKEKWLEDIPTDTLQIIIITNMNNDKKVEIKGYVWNHVQSINSWSLEAIQLFYEHLDWFEQELGKKYCRKA